MLTIGMLFWLVMIVWLVFYAYRNSMAPKEQPWSFPDPIMFLLLALLGIGIWGWPIKG